MEAVILCGVQGAGKTTLYRDRFVETHVRVAMDLLRTRAREEAFLRLCLEQRQRFVVDATNATAAERRRYVEPAHEAGFRVIGYLVDVADAQALARNRRAWGAGAYRPRRWWAPAGACCARRPRRASTSSGTPPPAPTAAGASNRC